MPLAGALGEYALGEFVETPVSPVSMTSTVFQMQLGGDWEEFTADVRSNPHPVIRRGFEGAMPTDRVARTGTMTFTLDNSTHNSAGLLGYYSPDHHNCRAGFGIGTAVRFIFYDSFSQPYYKFYGKIVSIEPEMGMYAGRGVAVTAVDYMEYLANTNLQRLALQVGKRPDEIIGTIVSSLPIAPLATDYATATGTLGYALYGDRDEKTSAMNACQKVLQSDLGYLFVRGDTTGGETLTYQHRYTRLFATTVLASLSDDMQGLMVRRKADDIYNDIRVTTYPIFIDAAATTVLATAQTEFKVTAGSSTTITLRYRDPSGASTRVSGTDMVTPSDSTDYEFTATPGSGNNDLTGLVAVTADFGANSAQLVSTNSSTADAYSGGAEVFQIRGKGIYGYDPVESVTSDSDSIAAYGTRSLSFDMPYQTDINVGASVATELLNRMKDPVSHIESVTFASGRSTTFHDYAVQRDIGDRITMTETATGVVFEGFINAVELEMVFPGLVLCTWLLEPLTMSTGGWTTDETNPGTWGTNAGDSGVWGVDNTDSTDWM